jgi:hypothetical protein
MCCLVINKLNRLGAVSFFHFHANVKKKIFVYPLRVLMLCAQMSLAKVVTWELVGSVFVHIAIQLTCYIDVRYS